MKFTLSCGFAAILAVGCCQALTIDWDLLSAPHVVKQPEPSTFVITKNRPAPPTRPKETVVVVEIDHKKETQPHLIPSMDNVQFEVINSKPVAPKPFGGEQYELFYQQQQPLPNIYHHQQQPPQPQEPETLPFFMGGPLQVNQEPKEELQQPETLPAFISGPFHINQKPKEPQPPVFGIVYNPKPQPKPVEVIDLEFSVNPVKSVDMIDGIVVPSPKYPKRPHYEIDVAINQSH